MGVPVTVFGVATALARGPGQVARHAAGRLGDRQPRAEMDRLPRRPRGGRARPNGRGRAPAHGGDGRAAARLVHRAVLDEHGPPGGRAGLRLGRGFLCRRPALLVARRRAGPTGRALHARRQRHALCDAAGLQLGRPVLRLSARQLRLPVPGGRRRGAEDDVGRPALPAGRAAGADGGAAPVPRACGGARRRLVRAADRHRPALGGRAPAGRSGCRPGAPVRDGPGRLRGPLRRRLRAFALGCRAGLGAGAGAGARHGRGAAQRSGAGVSRGVRCRAFPGAAGASRPGGPAGDGAAADRRLGGRAGSGRARRADRCRAGRVRGAERRAIRPPMATRSSSRCATTTRPGSWRPSAAVWEARGPRSSAKRANRSSASPSSAWPGCCHELSRAGRRAAAAIGADDRARRLHRGLCGDPARRAARHRDQRLSRLARGARLGAGPPALGLCRDLQPRGDGARPGRRQRPARDRPGGRVRDLRRRRRGRAELAGQGARARHPAAMPMSRPGRRGASAARATAGRSSTGSARPGNLPRASSCHPPSSRATATSRPSPCPAPSAG